MRRMVVLALGVGALFLPGCGGEEESGGTAAPGDTAGPATVGTTSGGETTRTSTAVERIRLQVYFLRGEDVGVAARLVDATPAVGAAAVRALLDGPTAEEAAAGLTSAIPAGASLVSLEVDGGVAAVELSRPLESETAQAQLVHTLTQFPTVESVSLDGGEPVGRDAYEEQAPQILLESPAVGEAVSPPLRIVGTANTFEATFMVTLLDANGRKVAESFVTATSGSGTRGTFDFELPFAADAPFEGTVKVWEASAKDGSEIHAVEVPVAVEP